jgi:hypothetical protein
MATEELQQKELHPKGQRTVAFLKANGKSLTRAERAQRAASYGKSAAPPSVIIRHTSMGQAETTRLRRHSHFEPMVAPVEEVQTASVAHGRDSLNTSAGSLANHHGPARMSPDASLFNLDVPPIMASAPTPHHDLSMLDEPTIPYPEHVSRSYAYVLEPPGSYPEQMVRTPRWASPELPAQAAYHPAVAVLPAPYPARTQPPSGPAYGYHLVRCCCPGLAIA